MSFWFILSLLGMIAIVPIHFVSVEHERLEQKYGTEKGKKLGSIFGMVSGWGIFIFMIGLWISPQPRFYLVVYQPTSFSYIESPFVQFIVAIALIIPGAWLGIKGVSDIGLEPSETHRSRKIINTGLYSRMRHPQYTGAMLSHIGMTFLFSALYSLLVTPFVIIINYILCWKEERELVREFGEEYESYRKSVPMFIPRFRGHKISLSSCKNSL